MNSEPRMIISLKFLLSLYTTKDKRDLVFGIFKLKYSDALARLSDLKADATLNNLPDDIYGFWCDLENAIIKMMPKERESLRLQILEYIKAGNNEI